MCPPAFAPSPIQNAPHLAVCSSYAIMHRPARFTHEVSKRMNSRGQNTTETPRDPRNLTFSQAYGHEEIPRPLRLGELPKEVRTHIWNVFYEDLDAAKFYSHSMSAIVLVRPWDNIFKSVHINHDHQPVDDWNKRFYDVTSQLRSRIETQDFNKVFDLLEFVMSQPGCPRNFIGKIKGTFARFKLAYIIDDSSPPTILPATTQEEGEAILESLQTLREAGLSGGAEHLRKASACINQNDWAGSIRESIHARRVCGANNRSERLPNP